MQNITLSIEDLIETVQAERVVHVSATHTITSGAVFICDASAGAFAITLPAAKALSDVVGQDVSRILRFKKKDSSVNAITITRAGSDTIDGSTTFVLTSQYDSVMIADDQDGDAWNIMSTN